MDTLQRYKKEFLSYLENKLKPKEFFLFGQAFLKDTPIGKEILHVAFSDYHDKIDISPTIEIRHDKIEKLYDDISGEDPDTPTATIGISLSKISMKGETNWSINNSTDISLIGDEILEHFWDYGIPVFSKYSSMKELFPVLADDQPSTNIYCIIPHLRAKKALVAAYIEGKTSNQFDDLVDRKVQYLKDIENPYLVEVLDFAFLLRRKYHDN